MKQTQNDKTRYLSRSKLVQSSPDSKHQASEHKDRGDFRVDLAGYFSWPKRTKLVSR